MTTSALQIRTASYPVASSDAVHVLALHNTTSPKGMVWVWLGSDDAQLTNLLAAMPSAFSQQPASAASRLGSTSPSSSSNAHVSKLMGSQNDETGPRIAQRLAVKYGRPFFVSWNVPSDFYTEATGITDERALEIERRLYADIAQWLKAA
ncbi:hypothetical protein GQ42DRAFT_163936 [Ramicandelaber brevisporus]|nr:hypothetical protein GQ42DRAFT_163936 [Ramicandelaber brevisporus]